MDKHPRTLPGAFAPVRVWLPLLAFVAIVSGSCVQANPPTDTGNPVAPSSPSNAQPTPTPTPTPTSGQALAYNPDLKPIFDSDCVVCHSGSRPSAGYSMSTYANVMRAVVPGNANSPLVVWSLPGGTMYRYWTGNASQKAAMVRQWVVNDNAAQSR
jgi:hypothetical protein